MKDEWSGSRQVSVEAVGSRKPDCLLLQFFLLCFHSSHIVLQSDGKFVIAG